MIKKTKMRNNNNNQYFKIRKFKRETNQIENQFLTLNIIK